MRESQKKKNFFKKLSDARDSFSPTAGPRNGWIALSAIVSVNKAFAALFLFTLLPGKTTGASF